MTELKEWVRAARKHAKLTQDGLAERLELTKAAVSAYETGRNAPSVSVTNKIAEITKYPAPIGKIIPQSNARIIGGIETWDDSTPVEEDEFEAPFYKDIKLAAGNGFADDIQDYSGKKLRFSKSTLRKRGVNPEDVVCVSVDGDSMDPVIPDGTSIGIDTGNTTIKDGKVYAFNHGGLLRTKILQNLPDGEVRIRSYNHEEYPDEIVDIDDIHIIGRVFWWSVID